MKRFLQHYDTRRRFLRQLRNPVRILDLGCGSGYNCRLIKSLFPAAEIYGVDIISEDQAPDNIRYFRVDLNNGEIPFPDSFFDAVIFTHVIEHLQFPLRCGGEIGRVLAPGGLFYIEAPNWTSAVIPSFGFKRSQQGPFNFYDDPTHLKPWSVHSLYNFVSQCCGLQPVRSGVVRNPVRLAVDPAIFCTGLVAGKRGWVMSSVWNVVGWAVYCIGRK